MKFTMNGFNQRKLIEFGLDLKDAALLRYFVDFKDTNSMSMIIIDNKPYYWLKYEALKDDLPILGINSNVVLRRRLKKLEKCGILQHYHKLEGGSFSYYGIGDNYKCLLEEESAKDFNNFQENQDNSEVNPQTEKFNPLNSKVEPLKPKSLTPQTEKFKQNNPSTKDNKYIYSAKDVEEIWKLYPNKKGRAQAFKKIPLILNKIGKEKLIKCIEIYSREVKGKDKQYILNGSTFFNGRYLDYLDTNFTADNDSTNVKTRDKPNKPKYKFILEEDM